MLFCGWAIPIIDSIANRIDILCEPGSSVKGYVIQNLSDSDTTRLNTIYYIDSLSCQFFKTIYDCTFNGEEKIDFYYNNKELIKAKLSHFKEGEFYHESFYFQNDSLIHRTGTSPPPAFVKWTEKEIDKQAAEYLQDSFSICNYIRKKSNK